jgi:hypothetical protein
LFRVNSWIIICRQRIDPRNHTKEFSKSTTALQLTLAKPLTARLFHAGS